LADFYDVDALAENALKILKSPEEYEHLGTAARNRVVNQYEQELCINQLVNFFKEFKRS